MTLDSAPHLRAIDPAQPSQDPAADPDWDGVTRPQRRAVARFLTDVIVDLGFVNREKVDAAIEQARSTGESPEEILVDKALITTESLSRAIAARHGLDHLDLTRFAIDMSAANLLDNTAAKRYEAVPVSYIGERCLLVAMADPANVLAVDDLALMTGFEIRVAVASREDLLQLISKLSRLEDIVASTAVEHDDDDLGEIVDMRESAGNAPVIKLVNQIISQAVDVGASDLHFSAADGELRVRFRIDGVLQDSSAIPRRMVNGVISRIKIMSDLDISERRIPQDGRVGLAIDDHYVDLRIVTLPSVHGESIVIRILDKEGVVLDLQKLGMGHEDHSRFYRGFTRPHGAVLVTGPTGSGKSTSLYAALSVLNTPDKNIITIEDPVEYQFEGITQVQINAKAGLTFAKGLRSMMRADPDILMVGEIRDPDTAKIAIEGALTGHLVLSTLHTNDAPTAITRLIEMGIEPFLVASALDCVMAQRLARMLCQHCKRRAIVTADVLRRHDFPAHVDLEVYEPVGCVRCNGSGYRGRLGLYEVMEVTEEIRSLAIERGSADLIAASAVANGMRRLREDGLEKVKQGRTSIAEIARVTG